MTRPPGVGRRRVSFIDRLGAYAATTSPSSTITQLSYNQLSKMGSEASAPYTSE